VAMTNSGATTFGGSDSGSLLIYSNKKEVGKCALEHSSVDAEISGYVARVSVTQTFQNPYKNKIEAVYSFPLPDTAAVDEMEIKVGLRTIRGIMRRREEARQIYE